jgi:hypothetical protein
MVAEDPQLQMGMECSKSNTIVEASDLLVQETIHKLQRPIILRLLAIAER